MRVESTYPHPTLGVSTLAPRTRKQGMASLQENLRSDPVKKLTRRPPSNWVNRLVTGATAAVKHHEYRRDSQVFRYIIESDGTVSAFVDEVAKTVNGNLSSYITDDTTIELSTIKDTTFVVDTATVVALETDTDESDSAIEKVNHLNVAKALNYQETITIIITRPDTLATDTVSYTAPAASDGNADAERATSYVAAELATAVNASTLSISALSLGSSVAIWHDSEDIWLELDVETGQGVETVKVINDTVRDPLLLPLYAVHLTRIEVQADPNDDRGKYYLEAQGTSDNAVKASIPANRIMEEVVWVESRSPDEAYAFDATTMPHTIVYDAVADEFDVGVPSIGWDDRAVGDDKSNPAPDFIGRKINAVGQFQKRLVVLADDQVFMSETQNLFGFWKQTALKTIVTDPVGIASSAAGIDKLRRLSNHNKDLMIIASNGQFKITGSEAVTPETVSMPLTTTVECQTDVEPVAIGNSVFIPITYGESTGLFAYTGEQNTTQDQAQPVTAHVVGYMGGTVTTLAGSSNLEMLFMTTSDSLVNEFFVYEQQRATNGVLTQMAWSKWILPTTNTIIDMTMNNDTLSIICLDDGDIVLKQIKLYQQIALGAGAVFLDDYIELDSSTGDTVTLPTGYNETDLVVVKGTDTDYPLETVAFTSATSVLTFADNISGGVPCTVYVGKQFRSAYRPTRPFTYTDDGVVNTLERVRVNRWIAHLADTFNVKMSIISDYVTFNDQEFVSNELAELSSTLGEVSFTTGDAKFSYSQEAGQAEAEFYTDSYLGWTLSGLSWEGQIHRKATKV